MSAVNTFIQRPVGISLLALALVLCGALCWRLLPVAPLPQLDIPMIVVTASLPGASPESMATTVATPMERALGSISGVTAISSSSSQGSTQVALTFELERDLNEAAREVQAAINAVRGDLPAGMPGNPQYVKIDPSQAPIMGLALSSPNLASSELYDIGATILAQKLAQISGVGEVTVDGASLPAVRMQIDAGALLHYGLSLDEVRNAISRSNALRPMGVIEEGAHRWQVQTSDALRTAKAYRELVVRYDEGAVVRLGDVAEVTDSVENRYSSGFHNDRPAVILNISRQSGANIVETIDNIYDRLPQLLVLLPADAELSVIMDRSPVIRATLREAQISLLLAALLVVVVVWLFLGNFRAALIPSAAIPVSLIGSFVVMYFWGFSLNNLSLMALIVGAGLVVDDAIVVLENVQRHMANGLSPQQAAARSARELSFTLIAMTLALAVVFASILLLGGLVKQLFEEFSITLIAAMLISLLVSLTLTPSLCAHWLQRRGAHVVGQGQGQGDEVRSESLFAGLQRGYARSLSWTLDHRPLALLTLLGAILASGYLLFNLPEESLPQQDTGQIRGFIRGDDGLSFQVMQPKIEAYRQYILSDPAVQDLTGTSGGNGGLTNAQLAIRLKPLAERKLSSQQVIDRLRANAPAVPGVMMYLMADQDLHFRGPFGNSENEVVLRSDSLEALKVWARRVAQAMEQSPLLTDVDNVDGDETRQMVLTIDREAARRLGVDMQTIASVLNNSFSQRQVATLYDELNQYRVVMELAPRYTERPAVLDQLEVLTSDGQRVPFTSFATWDYGMAEDRVRHEGQFASMGIGYSLAPEVTEGEADAAIEQILNEVMLPSEVHQAPPSPNDFGNALNDPWAFVAVLLAVYLVLGVLYESTLHPLTILSTLPPAGLGALLALQLGGQSLSLIAMLGLFLLIGIVMKNAIMMIDFALDLQRREGLTPQQGIHRAALLRLRPILMTNMAGMLGAVPLILGFGEGAEMRRPLGITIFGGLALSQLLTLYTTPAVYLYLENLRQRWLKRGAAAEQSDSST
ncbi:multidrug efflux pump [Halopseudomonas sabulinigri]|uniref:Multidrug efflux pump n=1 Tax=Halopseudomonas sabulinigri TaxID=472181 RepID=A0A1H1NA55_9GAMM|nr:efflux RND transporter permease subunit [Halopseudomonas sabulinigri]SDR95595.1 multidrug efflux pump [Halopseudomonas sabulinigri]